MQNVYGVAIGPDDRIYVSGDDSVLVFDGKGILQSEISSVGSTRCLTVDGNHNVYLGMEDHVEVYDQEGEKKADDKRLLFYDCESFSLDQDAQEENPSVFCSSPSL